MGKSILKKFTLLYLLLVFLPITLLMLYNLGRTYRDSQSQAKQVAAAVTDAADHQVRQNVHQLEYAINLLSTNNSLLSFLSSSYQMEPATLDLIQRIQPLLGDVLNGSAPQLESLRLYVTNPNIPEADNLIFQADSGPTERFPRQSAVWLWEPPGEDRAGGFVYVCPIRSSNGKAVGFLTARTSVQSLFGTLAESSGSGERLYIYQGDSLVYSSGGAVPSALPPFFVPDDPLISRDGLLYTQKDLAPLPMRLVVASSLQSQAASLYSGLLVTVLLLYVLLLSVGGFYLFSKRMLGRIRQCVDQISNITIHGLPSHLEIKGEDEIGQLSRQFNLMLDKIEALVSQSIRQETAHKDVQLKALLLQINPHFIYNTIGMFAGKMELLGAHDTADYMADFAQMIRYNVHSTSPYTTLRAEVAYARSYIGIQRCKYNGRIEFSSFVPEPLLGIQTLRFIIQPILENAVIHGLSGDSPRGLSITLRAHSLHGVLYLCVRDDGCGMSSETLSELNRALCDRLSPIDETARAYSKGIGLLNINSRLRLTYGEEFHLVARSKRGRFTKIILRIPLSPFTR